MTSHILVDPSPPHAFMSLGFLCSYLKIIYCPSFLKCDVVFGRPLFQDVKWTFTVSSGRVYQRAYVQLICLQIPKVQKDSQVISRKKVDQLVVLLLFFSGFALYTVGSSLMK